MADQQSYCYIHIGVPKTGSTFLQRVFFDNREALLANGLLYPDVSLRGYAHHDIAFLLSGGYPEWATPQPRSLSELAADLAVAAKAHAGSLLLSSEDFFLYPEPGALRHLLETAGAMRGRPARVIVYLRRQDEAHESWYNQRVKAQGEAGSIEACIEAFHDLWDYERRLELWSDAFGKEAMVVRRYLGPAARNPSLLQDAMGLLDIPDLNLILADQPVNVGENRDILHFQRQLNRLPMSPPEKRRFHKQLMELSERAKGLGLFDERPLLSEAERQSIMDRYAESNSVVSKLYFGGEPLFPSPQKTDGTVQAPIVEAGLTSDKVLYILGWLLAHKE